MMRIYKKEISYCGECPNYEPGWCKKVKQRINQENLVLKRIPSFCDLQRPNKTKKQNDYYWPVIVRTLANEFGYTEEEMHDTLRYLFLREENPGKPVHIKSTRDLDTKQTEEYYERIRVWSAMEYGIYIPLPNER